MKTSAFMCFLFLTIAFISAATAEDEKILEFASDESQQEAEKQSVEDETEMDEEKRSGRFGPGLRDRGCRKCRRECNFTSTCGTKKFCRRCTKKICREVWVPDDSYNSYYINYLERYYRWGYYLKPGKRSYISGYVHKPSYPSYGSKSAPFDGYDKEGYDKYGYDKSGFDKKGYDIHGYNKDGYNVHGFDRSGYSKEGYDKEGYNSTGYDRDGNFTKSIGSNYVKKQFCFRVPQDSRCCRNVTVRCGLQCSVVCSFVHCRPPYNGGYSGPFKKYNGHISYDSQLKGNHANDDSSR